MAATSQDFVSGIDLTGLVTVTAAQLTQLIESGSPFTDKGIVVSTIDTAGIPDVPDASVTTKWQKYLWLRIAATSVIVYAWNPNGSSDVTLLKWSPITIAAIPLNSVTNGMLQGGITSDKIASVSINSIIEAANFILATATATGDLAGSLYSNLVVAAKAITAGKLYEGNDANDASRPVYSDNIKNLSIELSGKASALSPSGKAGKIIMPATKNLILKCENITPPSQALWVAEAFSDLSVNTGVGTGCQEPRMKADASALEWVNSSVIQIARVDVTAAASGTNIIAQTATPDSSGDATHGQLASAFNLAFTPKISTSKLRINFKITVAVSTAASVSAWVMDGAVLIGADTIYCATASFATYIISGSYIYNPAVTTARAIKLYYGIGSAGTAYINRDATNATLHNGTISSYMEVQEITGTFA